MEKDLFSHRFREASKAALDLARTLVIQELPDSIIWHLLPNQSYDGNKFIRDEQRFPEDSLGRGRHLTFLRDMEAVNWLWRDGKVPEWIDVNVKSCDENFTTIELLCCGRYTADGELLYHRKEGRPPFHVLGPDMPWWDGPGTPPKFDLHWRQAKTDGSSR